MGFSEPVGSRSGRTGSTKFAKAVQFTVCFQVIFGIFSSVAIASWSNAELTKNITQIVNLATGWHSNDQHHDFGVLLQKADEAVNGNSEFSSSFRNIFNDDAVKFTAERAIRDDFSTTVKFAQTYNGLEVVGHEAMVHFDSDGEIHDVSGEALNIVVSTEPALSVQDARRILDARYGQRVSLSEPARLKVLKDFDGSAHLVYHMLTSTTPFHDGQEVYLDAHSGQVVIETDRAYDLTPSGSRTVFTADTEKARQHIDERGYPTDINLTWYEKVVEDGKRSPKSDQSALNAYRNAGMVYSYFRENFNRRSYDNKDSRIVSVVHMGRKMNNAFWTTEFGLMAYGDGDGEHLVDLTKGLDVAAHELTHGVTANTAKLIYAAEAGALNESYSDVFAKMVDYNGNWDIGARVMAPKWGRRALRNMARPEEFKQPGSNDSPLRVRTTPPCTRSNDNCGVHTNSGIPSRAAVLIVKAIGKQKTERLYYKVLTARLSSTATFKDARRETEKECGLMFGKTANECKAVTAAFNEVKM